MKSALFTNFSSEEFIGYWNGKGKKFAPGQSLYMPDYLAKHFAKHLANRELLKAGKERDTSPKVKIDKDGNERIDNEPFIEMFNKAYTPDETEELGDKADDIDTLIEVTNKNREEGKTDLTQVQSQKQDPTKPQIVVPPDFDDTDDDSFENNPVE